MSGGVVTKKPRLALESPGHLQQSANLSAKKKGSAEQEDDQQVETMVVRFQTVVQQPVEEEPSKEPTKRRAKEASLELPNLDIPLNATNIQLERLLNELLHNKTKTPYAFFVDSNPVESRDGTKKEEGGEEQDNEPIEIIGTIKEVVEKYKLGTEHVLQIKYKPLSIYRVHPVTRCTDELPGHAEAILHVSFSPDGENLASGGGDTTVRFWDVHTRTPKHVCKEHKDHVLCTAWSPDGTKFASGDKKGVIMVWDPKTAQKLLSKALLGHKDYITALVFEPLHRSTGDLSTRLLSGSKDGTAKLWNLKNGRLIMTLTNHTSGIESVRWGGEGMVYTASRDKTINVWKERDSDDPNVNRSPFKICHVLKGHGHRVNALALSTDYICRTGAFNPVEEALKNTSNTKEAALERYEAAKAAHAAESAEGSIPFERLVSCSDDFTLFLWHPTKDKKPAKRLFGHQQAVTHINFSPNGRYLASASFDKKIKLWCGLTGNFLSTCVGHVGRVYQVVFSPDSRLVASASKDSTLKVWEVRNSKKAKSTLAEHFDEVYALDWSPNGMLMASGGKDRLLRIWSS